jgi:Uma2 family endonuclease
MTIQKALKHDFDEAAFLRFLEGRPEGERWQLIDGESIQMMTPPSIRHQKIASELQQLMNAALGKRKPDLVAVHEMGLAVPGLDDFRPIADLAVIPASLDDGYYADEFLIAVEIVSPSNTRQSIERKRLRYMEAAACLHVLIVAQDSIQAELWSRSRSWQVRHLGEPDDAIDMPEIGFSCHLGALYRNTPLR